MEFSMLSFRGTLMANMYVMLSLSVRKKTEMILCDDNDCDSLENNIEKVGFGIIPCIDIRKCSCVFKIHYFLLFYVWWQISYSYCRFWSVDACQAAEMLLDICHVFDLIIYTDMHDNMYVHM